MYELTAAKHVESALGSRSLTIPTLSLAGNVFLTDSFASAPKDFIFDEKLPK